MENSKLDVFVLGKSWGTCEDCTHVSTGVQFDGFKPTKFMESDLGDIFFVDGALCINQSFSECFETTCLLYIDFLSGKFFMYNECENEPFLQKSITFGFF